MEYVFNELDVQAIQNGVLRGCLKKFTKNSKVLQAHDYMMVEDPDFKGKVIDVGSGPGVLAIMSKLKNPELDITIMDGSIIDMEIAATLLYNAGLIKYANKSFKIKLGLIGDVLGVKYDTVVLNHIVEHLDDLDSAFDWIMDITNPGGTIFIAVPYKDCHFSPNHTRFFKVTKDNDEGMLNRKHKCFDIEKYLNKRGYNFSIKVFDESKLDKRQPYDSRGQLDMVIKIKKPESGIVASDTITGKGSIDPEEWLKPIKNKK